MKVLIVDNKEEVSNRIAKCCSSIKPEAEIDLVRIRKDHVEDNKLIDEVTDHILGNAYNLLFLDVRLPQTPNGISIAESLRREGNNTSIIFLSLHFNDLTSNDTLRLNNISNSTRLSRPYDIEDFRNSLENIGIVVENE